MDPSHADMLPCKENTPDLKIQTKLTLVHAQSIKVACSNCNLRELCMPVGLNSAELERVDELVAQRRKVKRGATLFRNGEKFSSLYAIRTGFFKTCVATEDGRDQVTGFQMAGEIVGLDGIVHDHHTCNATCTRS
jgi:CRP/FNR family transcriptional regulator